MGRVYESNGPDVKVRGTAQTVADKYMQLARDAHSSGDRVMAESYYQYAEHYLRLLATAQPGQSGSQPQQRRPGGDDGYDDGDDMDGDDEQQPAAAVSAPRPHQPHSASGNGEAQPQTAAAEPAGDGSGLTDASDDGEQPWGGPEPEFLRRGPANGTARSRRQPRSRTRAKGSEDNEPNGENSPEQAN